MKLCKCVYVQLCMCNYICLHVHMPGCVFVPAEDLSIVFNLGMQAVTYKVLKLQGVYVCVCSCASMCARVCSYVPMCAHLCVCECACMCVCECICVYMHVYQTHIRYIATYV